MAENKEILTDKGTPEQISSKLTTREGQPTTSINSRETYARVPPEVKTWMQKVEEDPASMKTVTDDLGKPLLTTSTPKNPKVQLPASRNTFVAGFKKKVDEAGKWLSAFILRLIKKNEGNVKFKEE